MCNPCASKHKPVVLLIAHASSVLTEASFSAVLCQDAASFSLVPPGTYLLPYLGSGRLHALQAKTWGWERKWRRPKSSYLIGIISEWLPCVALFSVEPHENSRCLWILHFSFFPHGQMDVFPNGPFAAPLAMRTHLATHHRLPSAQVLFLLQMALVKIPVASRLAGSPEWHESGPQEIHFIAHSLLICQLLNITVSSHLNLLVGIRF